MEIELESVTKQYGPTRALDGVDLTVDSGQRIGLVGPNGSGKTTLIRAIMGLIEIEGRLRVDGRSPFDERRAIADRMAYVPQIAPEFATPIETLVETVARSRDESPEAAAEITAELGFELGPHLGKPYRALSGGMKQKLLIGLAMAGTPDLLIMDEPTASLDAAARSRFFDLCGGLDDLTLVLCSHRLGEIRHLVEEIVELEAGAVRDVRDVGSFVADTGRVFVECQFSSDAEIDPEPLRDLGFEPSVDGHWSGVLEYDQKMPAIRTLYRQFDERLEDLVVEDVDTVDSSSLISREATP